MDIEVIYQIISALAGLGVLLYGIRLTNSSLENVLGYKFKSALGKVSKSKMKNFAIGAGTTFLVQSSVLTVTMAAGLINIGAIGLAQALALTLGANLGSACSMVLLSFESFNLVKILSVLSVFGMILLIFAKKSKVETVAKTILGFGFLCLGITLLSESMFKLTSLLDIAGALQSLSNPIVLILLGVILAVLMQSAYPVVAILITLVASGATSFESALFVLYGANIGASITIMFLTGFGDGTAGRKVVVFNLLLKIFSTLIFGLLMLIPSWVNWIHQTLCFGEASVSLVVMMILFNLIPELVLLPFVNLISVFLGKIIKSNGLKENNDYELFEIDERVINNPAIAFKSVKDNVARILEMEISLNRKLCSMLFDNVDYVSPKNKLKALDKAIKLTTNNIIRLGSKKSQDKLENINILLNILNDISQILRVNTKFDEFANFVKQNPKCLGDRGEILKNLARDTNDLGERVCKLLFESENIIDKSEEIKTIFEINSINTTQSSKAKQDIVSNAIKTDSATYFSLLYELGKLENDYTDIAIKITLMEE